MLWEHEIAGSNPAAPTNPHDAIAPCDGAVEEVRLERLGISRGWLQRVSVRRPWRQRGLARALIAESFRVLRERGVDDACLGVNANNPSGALRLYESMGFEQIQSGRLYVRAAPR